VELILSCKPLIERQITILAPYSHDWMTSIHRRYMSNLTEIGLFYEITSIADQKVYKISQIMMFETEEE